MKTIKEQRKYIRRRIVSELSKMKQEQQSIEQNIRQILRMKNNEDHLLLTSIVTKVKDLWNRKEIQHENDIVRVRLDLAKNPERDLRPVHRERFAPEDGVRADAGRDAEAIRIADRKPEGHKREDRGRE